MFQRTARCNSQIQAKDKQALESILWLNGKYAIGLLLFRNNFKLVMLLCLKLFEHVARPIFHFR
jgi:hypothetical protein